MMKNAFYFMLKVPCVLEIFIFCPEFFVIWKNGLIRKLRLIYKIMTYRLGKK